MKRPFLAALLIVTLLSACGGATRISSVEPQEIKSGMPVMIQIHGSGFKPGAMVKIGGVPAPQVVIAGSKQIVVMAPADLPAGAISIAVENKDGTKAELQSALKVLTGLSIASIEPASVSQGQEAVVQISGDGYVAGIKAFFNDQPAEVEFKSDRLLSAKVPALPAGLVNVRLEAPDGSRVEAQSGFQVLGPDQIKKVIPFREESDKLGLALGDMNSRTGIGVADFNNDGNLDFAFTSPQQCRILLGGPDGFKDATANSGITAPQITYGAFPADFDNDGLPDLMITGQSAKLFHNLGGARFEEVTARVGMPTTYMAWSATWGDYDGDGLVDVYLGAPGGEDMLLHNLGGKFEEVMKGHWDKMKNAGKTNNRQPSTFSAVFGDMNNDGFSELLAGIRGQESRFYLNRGGKDLVFANAQVGLVFEKNGFFKINWGLSWADFDNDGFLDLFSASGPTGVDLYHNLGGKSFANVTQKMGVNFTDSPLCPAWGDVDNDGWLDLALADNEKGVKVFRNRGDGSFENVSEDLAVTDNNTMATPMAITWVDWNRDGALDLFCAGFTQQNRMLINTPFPGRHWLQVKLEGTKSNAMGIGAIVVLEAQGRKFTQQVAGGSGYLASPPPILHFGLDQATVIDKLTVIWPGGSTQTMTQVPADQLLTVTQPGERKKVTLPPAPPASPTPPPTAAPAAPPAGQTPLPSGMIPPANPSAAPAQPKK